MRKRANWLAWLLHGVLGLFVGAGLALALLGKTDLPPSWLDARERISLIAGAALIGAGLGSRYGDRLWTGANYTVIPPDEPQQSGLSDWLSWSIVGTGFAFCLITLLKQVGRL